jgi:hypothetical protein
LPFLFNDVYCFSQSRRKITKFILHIEIYSFVFSFLRLKTCNFAWLEFLEGIGRRALKSDSNDTEKYFHYQLQEHTVGPFGLFAEDELLHWKQRNGQDQPP